jgi:hypothetical protein
LGGIKMKYIALADVNTRDDLMPQSAAFFCCASFEQRCKSISLVIDERKVSHAYIIYESKRQPDLSDTVNEIANRFTQSYTKPIDLSNPVEVADIFAKVIDSIIDNGIKALLLDITTFTHELLLILLKIIHTYKDSFSHIYCLYTGADSYGGLYVPNEQKWLSKGCKDVRNVLGYPGILRPSAKTSLIILAGFELERATRIIDLLEPDRIIIGNGIDPTNDAVSETMTFFRNKFNEWVKEYRSRICERFDFSCKDILSTEAALENIINKNPNENYILIPLNTKLSTIATALVALKNQRIQVCYSIPEIYNIDEYSTPGEKITCFELKDISPFA